jgi:GT2 family glycosyltransferase
MSKGAVIGTDTYFNVCSVGKWFTYCDIKSVILKIRYSGMVKIDVLYADYDVDGYGQSLLVCEELSSDTDNGTDYEYRIEPVYSGVVYYRISALSDGARLLDSWYEAVPIGSEKDAVLALNICTYKREEFLLRNVGILKDKFLDNIDSTLYGRLKVFVTDNGNTLDCGALSSNDVHICYNPNVGGAGGFTRGLFEISHYMETDGITHVIFMDDDVKIEPEAILRTYRLLRLLKDEYRDSFISGAMLSMSKPYIQHENGALWNMGKCVFVNRNLDLRKFENVVLNEVEAKRDYAAWWYCCMPASVIRSDNMPIPVFIHEDDVEYSLRNAKHILNMNGIAIWHPVAETIRLSAHEYYNLRNLLIVNAIHCPKYTKLMLCKKMLVNFGAALLRFRYRDFKLIMMALEDFCKGPDWLLGLDAVSYHKVILDTGYQLYDVKDRLKGYKIGKNAFYMSLHPRKLKWSYKRLLFDKESGKGLELKFEFSQLFVCMGMYVKSLYLILFKYGKSRRDYRRNAKKLQSSQYWNKVLGVDYE